MTLLLDTHASLWWLAGDDAVSAVVRAAIGDQGFTGLPVSVGHGQAAGALPGPHRDPFDRMSIARALPCIAV